MIFRLIEFSVGKEVGISVGSILRDNENFSALLAGIYNVKRQSLFVCMLGFKFIFKFGEDN